MFMFLQDVAVKVFSKQEYSDDMLMSFRQEVMSGSLIYLFRWKMRNKLKFIHMMKSMIHP